jgi:hypothetical protein
MRTITPTNSVVAALHQEMDDIHHVNSLYWRTCEEASSLDKAAYHARLARLEEIRKELARLRSPQLPALF